MRTSIKVKRAIKKFLIENDQKADKRWKSRKAQKGLLIIAGTITIITLANILINIAQAAPESLVYENKHIDFGTGIETESAEDTPEQKDEAEDGIAVNSISQMIAEKFPEDPKTAIAIAQAESGLRSDAVGDKHIEFVKDGKVMGHSCGIFQVRVLEGRPDCESLKDVEKNLEYARKLYDSHGWKPWSAFNNQSFKKFL